MQIQRDFDLSTILWYQFGGTAKYLLEVSSIDDITEAFKFVAQEKIAKFMPIGLGANLIFTDDYYDGAIIHIKKPETSSIVVHDTVIEAFAGELFGDMVEAALDQGLIGLEWAGGLPGTVGAGVRGNVGAFGGEVKDSLKSAEVVELLDSQVRIHTFQNTDFHFGYRDSVLKHKRNLLLGIARFALKKGLAEEVEVARKTYQDNINYRKTNHPIEYPTCGSVFKNIKRPEDVEKVLSVIPEARAHVETKWHGKVSMGYLIHYLGFAGYKVGQAQVSEKHNNFIVNLGGAKFLDVVTIIQAIQNKCQEVFGFTPEVEVEIVS
jgi:UDP-N-acetylmuramate dehydrogenase